MAYDMSIVSVGLAGSDSRREADYELLNRHKIRRAIMGSPADGRTQRSERSREAIVQALFTLVGEGEMQPTAQQVAGRAGVGIRTVFRHFSDMDTLYEEMNAHLRRSLQPLLVEVPPEGQLLSRASALARRRADLFERIAPYKRAGALQSWRSNFLQKEQANMMRELRADLLRWLPEAKGASEELKDALECATSFESWNQLRGERKLSRKRSAAALERMIVVLAGQLIS
jgi:AcrR family transcriptional regulator